MDLRISIVNYNTRDLLDRCLASIYAHPPEGEFEVVVVDNASDDDSVAMVRSKYPQVRVIACDANLGYAAGNNLALRDNAARYALILNSDIDVHPGALQTLIEFMDTHSQAGICGARLILPDGSVQLSCAPEPRLRRFVAQQMFLDRIRLAKYLGAECWADVAAATEPIEVEQISGACILCRRQAIEAIGPMDEGYWMYWEDTDYCRLLRMQGWTIHYVPQATMLHVRGGSSSRTRAEIIATHNHAAVRYFRRHQGPVAGFAARLIGLAGGVLRLGMWTVVTVATLGLVAHYRRQVALFARTIWLTILPPRTPELAGMRDRPDCEE